MPLLFGAVCAATAEKTEGIPVQLPRAIRANHYGEESVYPQMAEGLRPGMTARDTGGPDGRVQRFYGGL